jgi:peptide/nickel transport system substrate-binding protein
VIARGALVFLLAAAACSRADSAPKKKTLRVAYEREIDVLNPFTSQNLVDISFSMIEGLVTTDDHDQYVPVLARAIPTVENGGVVVRPDGKVDVTWSLHPNVKWHDGEPFTSKDVCFTWRFVVSPGSETYNREQYLGIKDCRTPDPTTVVFTWDGQYAYYAGLFEAILPEHVFGAASAEQIVKHEGYNRGPRTIGTGPFKFAEWRAGEYIRVVRNDDYWRGREYPKIDEIVWSFIPDATTRLLALRAGAHHFGRILPTQIAAARKIGGYDVHLVDSNSVLHLELGTRTAHGRALFGDERVREAIFHAIDREAIAKKLMEGTVKRAESPLNAQSPFCAKDAQGPAFDPARAARLLDEAGWVPGPEGVRRRGDERLSFTFLNRAGQTDRILVSQVIQSELKAIGVEANLETLESAAWSLRWRGGQWEAIVSAFILPADPTLTGLFACHGANNMTGACDPVLDDLLERSDRALAFADRKALLDEAQRRILATSRFLPLFYNVVPEVLSTKVSGYRGSGTNFGSFWNLYAWELAP